MEAQSLTRPRLPRPRRLLAALSDERLATEAKQGDDAAFEVLYERHHRGLLGLCRHLLGSREDAEDALQQTFASAFRALPSNQQPAHIKPWLYAIARNRCLTMLRDRRETPVEEVERDSTAGLSKEVERRSELRALLADLQHLPERQKTALVLSELGALDHSQIAQVLGCETKQVKALVFRARSALIEDRQAREIPCADIREQLATATAGELRRGFLRRHVRVCSGCADFRDDVRRQRRMLAVALPVVPSLGLKESALAAVGIGGGGGGAAGGGGLIAGLGAQGGAKVAAIVVATGGAAAGVAVTHPELLHKAQSALERGAPEARGAVSSPSDSRDRTTAGFAPDAAPATARQKRRRREMKKAAADAAADARKGASGRARSGAGSARAKPSEDRAKGRESPGRGARPNVLIPVDLRRGDPSFGLSHADAATAAGARLREALADGGPDRLKLKRLNRKLETLAEERLRLRVGE
jgi:RNA polymerase sigma factor (sigma-70 family)